MLDLEQKVNHWDSQVKWWESQTERLGMASSPGGMKEYDEAVENLRAARKNFKEAYAAWAKFLKGGI